jgi:hypothetical protein
MKPTHDWLVTLAGFDGKQGLPFSPAQWLLDNGKALGDWAPLPKRVKRGPIKQCYWNSLTLAAGSERYVYMEGYATHIIPVQHAWCYDRETGLVVDRTWAKGFDYVGVPVKAKYAEQCLEQERTPVLDWMAGYPIMAGEIPKEVWFDDCQ